MCSISSYHEYTVTMIDLLQSKGIERDEKIAAIENLLEQRESLLGSIRPPFTTEEAELGRRLVFLERKLEDLLSKEFSAIQFDIRELQNKKESNRRYINPYGNLSVDGVFYDQRK
ncbi:hypothetical protein [Bacillus massilinigeriensis]|uniref:hypothetical protein n=1 Tax=Bacillus mediterraneensis TaxID=1805474 RepID=UPI0008F83AEB|nr:hypothetical protein [Bacillus mediterraneensis]